MKHAELDPAEIGIWYDSLNSTNSLAERIRMIGWKNIPRVPVYELPADMQSEHKYVLIDGHLRREAAMETGTQLPCIIYDANEPIKVEEHNLAATFLFEDNYTYMLELYKYYQDSEK
jgi:ParB-like chromosome segregation protein Spo0J